MGHKVYALNGAKNVTAKLDTRVILDFLLQFLVVTVTRHYHPSTSVYISGGQQAVASESTKTRHTRWSPKLAYSTLWNSLSGRETQD
jgi:hypothetical protein